MLEAPVVQRRAAVDRAVTRDADRAARQAAVRLALDEVFSPLPPPDRVPPRFIDRGTLSVKDAATLMVDNDCGEIPVVDDEGRPVGLIDVQDLITMKIVQE